MTGVYEWEVRAGAERDIASCGVTGKPFRALGQMLRSLTMPRGSEAIGWVAVVKLAVPFGHHYERFHTVVVLERSPQGVVRVVLPGPGGKLRPSADAVPGRQDTAAGVCEGGR